MIKKILKNREFLWVIFSQIVQLLGAVLFTKIVTLYLTKENFGYYSLAMSLVAIVTMLPFAAFNEGIGRFLSIYKDEGRLAVMLSNIIVVYSLFLIPYIILSYFAYFHISEKWKDLLLVLNLFIVFEIFKRTLRKIENNDRDRKFVAKTTILESITKIFLAFFLVINSVFNIKTLLIILIISNFIVLIWNYLKRKNYFKFIFINRENRSELFKRLTSFSWPLLVWSIFGWLLTMANRWLLDYFLDKEAVAEFSLTSSIALLPSTAIAGILGAYLLPIIYQKTNTDIYYAWKIIKKTVFYQIIFYSILVFVFSIFGSLIIKILSSENYLNASWMLPYLITGSGFFAIGQVLTYEIFAVKETKRLLKSTIFPGIWSIFAGYFLIKNFGIEGAIINFISTYLIYLGLTTFTALKFHTQLLAKKNKYNNENNIV